MFIKAKAKADGLWNFFLTRAIDPRGTYGGKGLSTVEYAFICQEMGRSPLAAEVHQRESKSLFTRTSTVARVHLECKCTIQ